MKLSKDAKDLQGRMSRLSELSAELELYNQKLTDTPEDAKLLEAAYQNLFSETVRKFGDNGSIDTARAKSRSLAMRFYLSLDYTSRKGFYRSLSCQSKDQLYEAVTDLHIQRVPVETQRAANKALEKLSNGLTETEKEACWRSASWYFHNGDVSDGLLKNLEHMKPVFDALRGVYERMENLK